MSYFDNLEAAAADLGGKWQGSTPLAYISWEFYDLGVITALDGLYISTDSGCSCPTPFESHSRDDFTGPLTVEQAVEEFESLARAGSDYGFIGEDGIASGIEWIKGLTNE